MTAGRPRTVSLEPKEMIKLGEEMLQWLVDNKAIHVKQWYSLEKGISKKQWKMMIDLPEFTPYYELALNLVSIKYIDGTINNSIAQRFIRHYFEEVRTDDTIQKQEDQQFQKDLAAFVHTMRKEMTETVSEDVKAQFDSLMNQITRMQSKK